MSVTKRITPLGNADFQKLSEAVRSYCGLRVTREMGAMVAPYLSSRVADMQVADIQEYCRRLSDHPYSREWERELFGLIEKMTDNLDVD